jgi:hypothetical protein
LAGVELGFTGRPFWAPRLNPDTYCVTGAEAGWVLSAGAAEGAAGGVGAAVPEAPFGAAAGAAGCVEPAAPLAGVSPGSV